MRILWRGLYWTFVLLWLMMSAPTVSTAVAEPLNITKFTLQTTKAVKAPVSHDSYGFENVPYSFTQAGGHPEALTSTLEVESETIAAAEGPTPTRDLKDVAVTIPPGLLGNPTAVSRCPLKQALALGEPCPGSTQVGVAVVHLLHGEGLVGPIVNVIPETGQSAEFAIETDHKINFLLTGHVVRTPEGYGLTVVGNGIGMTEVVGVETTFWGVPAAEVNDAERGLFCEREASPTSVWQCGATNFVTGRKYGLGGEKSEVAEEIPFLTMPTDCAAGPQIASLKADSWEEPGVYVEKSAEESLPTVLSGPPRGVTGCDLLQFYPGIEVEPDTLLADAPVGLGVNVTVPQFEAPQRLSTPQLRDAVVTLPLGMSVNPGIVDGIQACSESGPEGIDFTGPESEERGANGESQLAAGHCPDGSIVGTAKAVTPLLGEPLEGHVYLAKPGCGDANQASCVERDAVDGNLYKLYLELGGTGPLAATGVHVKFPGQTQANLATGQLTTRFEGVATGDPPKFEGNPQLPFSKLEVHLNGGPRAAIANPAACGPALTTADFTPWAAPGVTPQGVSMAGLGDATPSSFFGVEGCGNPPGLAPGFAAGTVTPNAGKFSTFTLNIARKDREQYIKGVQVHTPPGLSGILANVQLCGAAEAESGTCSEASKIGTTRVASGSGSHPFEVEGNVYLTGPYRGSPFGLSVVTHVVAGPFNLGLVIVRARIDVNPENATLTVTTDESGPHALPQIFFGVPLRLKRITVDINRPSFMFNPTNCNAHQITAVISGRQNATASVQSPFAVGGCRSLAFKPGFKVSTNGNTSRSKGASLDTKLSYPKDALGSDANIARVKVSLPKQLPSRLSTLQKACIAAQFNTDPAGCPSASIVGIASANSPLLPVGLSGPVYFVSHGGESFPSLIIVLQGDNVRVDLVGTTFINEKTGITSSTFKTVPDVPVNTFELYLPQGKFSALAANGSLCKLQGKLKMPTEFVAQNGAVFKQATQIAVTGCKADGNGKVKKAKIKRRTSR
jgi:hypothetical protein